jgi:hypothetical protein
MRRPSFARLASVVILVAAVVVAVALVSTPLTDHSADCGTALDSAVHGVQVPQFFLQPPGFAKTEAANGSAGLFRNEPLAVVCRNVARERIAASAAVIAIAVVGVELGRRRRGGSDPEVVATSASGDTYNRSPGLIPPSSALGPSAARR